MGNQGGEGESSGGVFACNLWVLQRYRTRGAPSPLPRLVRGLLGTDPPDPTLTLPFPGVDLALIQHRFGIEIGSNQENDVESMLNRCQSTPEEGRARRIRGWGPGGLCLISPSQPQAPKNAQKELKRKLPGTTRGAHLGEEHVK